MKLICKKNWFWWKFVFQKVTFGSFYSKKRQILQLCVLSKTNNSVKKGKKTVFLSSFLKRIRFWNQFSTTSEIRIKFFKKEQYLGELYTTRHFLYRKFYSVSDFETSFLPLFRFWPESLTTQPTFTWNWFRNIKLSRTICFQKNYLLCQITFLKCQIWPFPTFLETLFLRATFLEKKHALNRKLWEKSVFESIFLQRLRL